MTMSVLVVDDSDIIRRMIVKTMSLAELPTGAVFEASNGREALQVLDESWVDLVLADLNMPVMDGLEMIGRMRATPELAGIPVVVVSTEGAESRIDELERLGISAYLRKPFTPEQIRDVLGRVPGLPHDERVAHTVERVVRDVLQRFTMVLAEPVEKLDPPVDGELLLGRTGLRGAVMGIVSVAAPLSLAREMAGNALGMDEADEDVLVRAADIIGEVANMVAGHVATEFDAREHTSLSPPIVTRLSAEGWTAMTTAEGIVRMDVEGYPLMASLLVRKRP